MKKTDLAYAAGIIDGEGCIYISKDTSRKKQGYLGLRVTVCSKDEWLCQYLKFSFGGNANLVGKYWQWMITTRQALTFLELVLPYLKLKRPQAEIAIQFQKAKKYRAYLTEGERAIEEAERLALKGMHSNKGRGG